MGTPLSLYLFLTVVIHLFYVNQAASENGVCTKFDVTTAYGEAITSLEAPSYTELHMGTRYVTVAVSYCCPNFDTIESEPLTCKSKCAKPCKNGECTSERTCACDKGYALDPEDKYNCLPICFKSCGTGACNAPCVCDPESAVKPGDGTCQPCTGPCRNRTCVDPMPCSCDDGYFIKIEENICDPKCSGGCEHGRCVSPGICICNPGWHKSNLNDTCVVDSTSFDDCVQWKYILVAVSILLTLVLILTTFIRRSR